MASSIIHIQKNTSVSIS